MPSTTTPLYTEIPIPLPPLPPQRAPQHQIHGKNPYTQFTPPQDARTHACGAVATTQDRRGWGNTIGALAVVPAVLVLAVELFTPGKGRRGGRQ